MTHTSSRSELRLCNLLLLPMRGMEPFRPRYEATRYTSRLPQWQKLTFW
jgi:hypothetical protein